MGEIIVDTKKKTYRIKSGSFSPDPQFLIIFANGKTYRFPWQNVICFSIEKS